jgi:hypothetical protein
MSLVLLKVKHRLQHPVFVTRITERQAPIKTPGMLLV